jgi:hypothetical protein
MRSTTLNVSIEASPDQVYDFVSNGANLPLWATTFCLSAEPAGGGAWRVRTPQGPVTMRLAGPNEFGILDHTVITPTGETVFAPMRVIPSGTGCEVLFTLFQMPAMSDERFTADLELVRRDLNTLKEVMERGR